MRKTTEHFLGDHVQPILFPILFLPFGVDGVNKIKSVKVGPPVHNYEHEAGSYGDGFT